MAHGENTAKQTVLLEVDKLQKKLDNGHAGDPETHGAALSLLISMVIPLFKADLQTVDGCGKKQEACGKNHVGWPLAVTVISVAGMLAGLAFKVFC